MGFGPFAGVPSNPAERLAVGLNERSISGAGVVGCPMPVSYERSIRKTRVLVEMHQPRVLLGGGIATERKRPSLELSGRNRCDSRQVDVDGVGLARLVPRGPTAMGSRLASDSLCQPIEAEISDDAGSFVCNSWLYQSLHHFPDREVGFLHIPPNWYEPDRVLVLLGLALRNTYVQG